jgi:predicted transcriptional regulator YdeE
MEKLKLNNEIKIMCLEASSFPEGIQEAFNKLEEKINSTDDRILFGISHGNQNGGITYKAAAKEVFDGEAIQLGLEPFTIPKGTYLSETIINWRSNLKKLAVVFNPLWADPHVDTSCPCIEWYQNENVVCMVKIK